MLLGGTSLSLLFNIAQELNRVRIVPVLTNLSVSRSSSILRPSISGLLSPIQEPSDAESEIGKMNGVSISQRGNTPINIKWGYAAHFSKPLAHL